MPLPTTRASCEQDEELKRLLREAQERYKAMSPEEQASMRAQQALGWVIAELTLGVFDPEPTPQHARAQAALAELDHLENVVDQKASSVSFLLAGNAAVLLPKARFELKTQISSRRQQLRDVLDPPAQ